MSYVVGNLVTRFSYDVAQMINCKQQKDLYMSHVMRKPDFCLCEKRSRSYCEADHLLFFAT